MIRVRKDDGTVINIPDAHFVEIYDPVSGDVAEVIYQPRRDAVMRITPGTTDAANYAGMFRRLNVKFASQIINRASA